MNSRDDPTQLQWRSLINCIIIGNDETSVVVLLVIRLMKVRSLTMTLQKSSCTCIIQMHLLSFRHYGYRPQPHCTTMKEANNGTWRRDKKTESERERDLADLLLEIENSVANIWSAISIFQDWSQCLSFGAKFCQNENEKNKREWSFCTIPLYLETKWPNFKKNWTLILVW